MWGCFWHFQKRYDVNILDCLFVVQTTSQNISAVLSGALVLFACVMRMIIPMRVGGESPQGPISSMWWALLVNFIEHLMAFSCVPVFQ